MLHRRATRGTGVREGEIVTGLSVEGRLGAADELADPHDGSDATAVQMSSVWPVALAAAVGAGMVFYATTLSIGTDADAATYLMAARDLLLGKGLTLEGPQPGHFVPMTGFPPLLPMAIAGIGYFGVNLMTAARWLNALLFGVNIFLAGYVVKHCTKSATAGICAALTVATSVDVLNAHATLYSEPLFLAAVLLGFISMLHYVRAPSIVRLCLFSAAFGAAGATRYVGVCLLPVGLVAIWLGRANRGERTKHLVAYLAIFAAPLALWVGRNFIDVHSFSNRVFAIHPPGLGRYIYSSISLSNYLLPAAVPWVLRIAAVAGIIWFASVSVASPSVNVAVHREIGVFRRLAFAFLISYILVFVVSQTFFDAQIWIAGRHLVAIYAIGALLVICQGYEYFSRGSERQRMAMAIAYVLLIAIGGARATKGAATAHDSGIGLTAKRWQDSDLIARIRKLNSDVPIISNSRAVVYLLTGRTAYPLPTAINGETMRVRPEYADEMTRIEDQIENRDAVLAIFTAFASEEPKAEVMALKNRWGLQELAVTPEGYLLGKRTSND